jgi:hypothetical protein
MHHDKIMMWKNNMKIVIGCKLGFSDCQTKMEMKFKLFVFIMKQKTLLEHQNH